MLRAIGRQLTTAQAQTAPAQTAPAPLPGYQLTEITIAADSPAAGRKLADVTWPPDSTPVIILRGHRLRQPQADLTLAPGDRVSLLTATPRGSPGRQPGSEHDARPIGREISHHE